MAFIIASPPTTSKPGQCLSSHHRQSTPLILCSSLKYPTTHHAFTPSKSSLKLRSSQDNEPRIALQNVIARAWPTKATESMPDPVKANSNGTIDSYRKVASPDATVQKPFPFGKLAVIVGIHTLSLFAPFYFNWSAVGVAIALYYITGFGITIGYHRGLAHQSFKLPKWLEYTFAYFGALAFQGDPIEWVSTHRYHHQFSDSERDPHSPLEGFLHSHVNWIFDANLVTERCGGEENAADLQEQPFYRFLRDTYVVHPIALAGLLYALGGVPFVVWGIGVRIVVLYQLTWLGTSICHIWGTQEWNTGDLSRNNLLVALFALGEGWHNNHHAFEYSAREGLDWWQIDLTWYLIRLLQAVGLADDVKLPTEIDKKRLALKATN